MYQRLYYARPVSRSRSKAWLLIIAIPVVVLTAYFAAIAIDIGSTGNTSLTAAK